VSGADRAAALNPTPSQQSGTCADLESRSEHALQEIAVAKHEAALSAGQRLRGFSLFALSGSGFATFSIAETDLVWAVGACLDTDRVSYE
jgi:hypothetical protein